MELTPFIQRPLFAIHKVFGSAMAALGSSGRVDLADAT